MKLFIEEGYKQLLIKNEIEVARKNLCLKT